MSIVHGERSFFFVSISIIVCPNFNLVILLLNFPRRNVDVLTQSRLLKSDYCSPHSEGSERQEAVVTPCIYCYKAIELHLFFITTKCLLSVAGLISCISLSQSSSSPPYEYYGSHVRRRRLTRHDSLVGFLSGTCREQK